MGAFIDLTGHKYSKLKVIKRIGVRNGSPLWKCKCECGKITNVTTRSLRSGNTESCGCIHKENLVKRNKDNSVHNGSRTRLYGVWRGMKQRCHDKNNKDYKNYGERGIKVCDEWLNSFGIFKVWAINNGYEPNAEYFESTIDRIDNDKGYYPENCRFVDMKVQANNRRDRYV